MSARATVAAAITTARPTWRVVAHGGVLDGVTGPTCVVVTEAVEPGVTPTFLRTTVSVVVLTGKEDPAKVEPDLEDLLFEVIAILDALDTLAWTRAERVIYDDRFQAYRITLDITLQKEH